MKVAIPDAMYKRARLIGGGKGIKQYEELRAYVSSQTSETIVGWERDEDGNLFAITDPRAALKTRKAVRDRPRPV